MKLIFYSSQQLLTESISSINVVVVETSASTEEVTSMTSQKYVVSEKLDLVSRI